jgi:tripartite-type tricarboxylate transporter receptor subunit TctC
MPPMNFRRRAARLLGQWSLLGLLSLGPLAGSAWAQAWPSKPIKVILPFAAGGGGDTVMRPIAQKLSEALGQQVVLENIAGAGGALGMRAAMRYTDGHTFVMISNTHAIIETLQPNLGYATLKDFVPVTYMASLPLVLVVNPNLPFKTTQELLAFDKQNPGKLNYASSGSGTVYHLVTEQFKHLSSSQLTHVPYKSSAVARTDVISGQVDLMIDGVATMKPFIDSGRVRALGVGATSRHPHLPNVPPLAEAVPGFNEDAWVGMMAPAGTPRAAVERFGAEIGKLLAQPEIRKIYTDQGMVVQGSTPAAFGATIKNDIDKWAHIIKTAKVKPD